jgi:hypothetical protein
MNKYYEIEYAETVMHLYIVSAENLDEAKEKIISENIKPVHEGSVSYDFHSGREITEWDKNK